jgi:hypothetical protein
VVVADIFSNSITVYNMEENIVATLADNVSTALVENTNWI